MRRVIRVSVMAACLAIPAYAEVTFEWATVGNAFSLPDENGYGFVTNDYRIAKHEVTNAQYAEFLNAVAATDTNALYNASMGTDPRGGITRSGSPGNFTYSVKVNMGDKPVGWISFYDAARFVNWLHNGQPTGAQDDSTTESGVYNSANGLRAAGATYFIPSEHEWYKAAYHQPADEGGDTDSYWLYATASNSPPILATADTTGDMSNPGPNVVNYSFGADWNGLDGNLTTVGSAGPQSASFYGTSDQGGNVWEWNEGTFPVRRLRGGSWDAPLSELESSCTGSTCSVFDFNPAGEVYSHGFRVGSPIPPGVNDECAGSLPIMDGTTLVDTNGATSSPQSIGCGIDDDLWFDYTATCTGMVTVTTCNEELSYNSSIAIYGNTDCANLDAVACSDDDPDCPFSFGSTVTAVVTTGATYKIRIGSAQFYTVGNAQVSITCETDPAGACCAPESCSSATLMTCAGDLFPGQDCDTGFTCPPVNDACADRIEIFDGTTPFDNTGATRGIEPPPGPCPGNFVGTIAGDLWYSYTSSCTGTVTVSTCDEATTFNTTIALYDTGGDCSQLSDSSRMATGCNECVSPFGASIATAAVVAGETYTVQVGGTAGFGSGVIEIACAGSGAGACCEAGVCTAVNDVSECDGGFLEGESCITPICPPVNDDCADAIPIFDGSTAFDNITATPTEYNGWIGPDPDCGGIGTTMGADVWYNYTSTCTGTLTVSTCNAGTTFPTALEIHDLGGVDDCSLVSQSTIIATGCSECVSPSGASIANAQVIAGNTYKIQAGGLFHGWWSEPWTDRGSGVIDIACCEGGDLDNCLCTDISDCADLNDDGLRDDSCTWWECDAGSCTGTEIPFADLGGAFGDCVPDFAADGNDRFHALNCFANTDPASGTDYLCEPDAPYATNVDAGGAFGQCCPDGVCDGNDAFHTLNAFAGQNPCVCPANFVCPCATPTDPPDSPVLCPAGPAPQGPGSGVKVVDEVSVRLEASQRSVRPGELVDVDVRLTDGLSDLRGYQLHVAVNGGLHGGLELVDIVIRDSKERVFAGLADWRAFNVTTRQVLAGLDSDGVETWSDAYLATFVFRASKDAAGAFTVELLHDDTDVTERTFLFPTTPGAKIEIAEASAAVIVVEARPR